MKTVKDDIWEFLPKGYYIVVPTNGYVNKDGQAAMGRGVAGQANLLFKGLAKEVGNLINNHGNSVFIFPRQKLITFPTKNHWKHAADVKLIEESLKKLKLFLNKMNDIKIVMPKIGCGNGKLKWEDVFPLIKAYLSEYEELILIVDNEQGDSRYWRGKNENNIKDEPEAEDRPIIYEPDTGLKLTYKDLLNGKK